VAKKHERSRAPPLGKVYEEPLYKKRISKTKENDKTIIPQHLMMKGAGTPNDQVEPATVTRDPPAGRGTRDAGGWPMDAGRGTLDAGRGTLDAGR